MAFNFQAPNFAQIFLQAQGLAERRKQREAAEALASRRFDAAQKRQNAIAGATQSFLGGDESGLQNLAVLDPELAVKLSKEVREREGFRQESEDRRLSNTISELDAFISAHGDPNTQPAAIGRLGLQIKGKRVLPRLAQQTVEMLNKGVDKDDARAYLRAIGGNSVEPDKLERALAAFTGREANLDDPIFAKAWLDVKNTPKFQVKTEIIQGGTAGDSARLGISPQTLREHDEFFQKAETGLVNTGSMLKLVTPELLAAENKIGTFKGKVTEFLTGNPGVDAQLVQNVADAKATFAGNLLDNMGLLKGNPSESEQGIVKAMQGGDVNSVTFSEMQGAARAQQRRLINGMQQRERRLKNKGTLISTSGVLKNVAKTLQAEQTVRGLGTPTPSIGQQPQRQQATSSPELAAIIKRLEAIATNKQASREDRERAADQLRALGVVK